MDTLKRMTIIVKQQMSMTHQEKRKMQQDHPQVKKININN
jgi:hypothetical protein